MLAYTKNKAYSVDKWNILSISGELWITYLKVYITST